MSEENDIYEFSEQIQQKIISMLVYQADSIAHFVEVIRPEFFENKILRDICSIILSFYKNYKRAPNYIEVANEIGIKLTQNTKFSADEYISVFDSVMKAGEVGEFDYVKDKVVEFAKYQAMKSALIESAGALKKQHDYNKVKKIIEAALLVGACDDQLGTFFVRENIEERLARRTKRGMRKDLAIPTGIGTLDEYLGGGLLKAEIGLIMGPAKRGKTIFVVNILKGALIANKNAVHYTFEMSAERLEDRYDSSITGISKEHLKEYEEFVKQHLDEFYKHPKVGQLVIKHFAAYTASTADIEAHLNKLRAIKGFKPDIIVIDYLGLMNDGIMKVTSNDSRYFSLGKTTKEILSLAQRNEYAIWIVHQSTRGSLKKDIVDLEDAADSLEPIRDSDVILTLNQTKEDRKLKPYSKMQVYIAGGREMEDKKTIDCFINYSINRISDNIDSLDGSIV